MNSRFSVSLTRYFSSLVVISGHILSSLLNDIYVFSIKVDGEVGEMLDVLSVMMEGVVEVDKEVDEDVYNNVI